MSHQRLWPNHVFQPTHPEVAAMVDFRLVHFAHVPWRQPPTVARKRLTPKAGSRSRRPRR